MYDIDYKYIYVCIHNIYHFKREIFNKYTYKEEKIIEIY